MPRIYVACLASYNSGVLHGAWIDADQDADDINEAVQAMLCESRFPNVTIQCEKCAGTGRIVDGLCGAIRPCAQCDGHGNWQQAEEWAIHDHEGFPKGVIGECTPLEDVAAWAELLSEHDFDLVVAASEVTSETEPDAIRSVIEDRFRGEHTSVEDYAAQLVEDCYDLKAMGPLANYIDFAAFGRDMEMGGDISTARVNGTLYIFDGN